MNINQFTKRALLDFIAFALLISAPAVLAQSASDSGKDKSSDYPAQTGSHYPGVGLG